MCKMWCVLVLWFPAMLSSARGQQYPAFFHAHTVDLGPPPAGVPDENDAYSVHDVYNANGEAPRFEDYFEEGSVQDLLVTDPGCPEPPEVLDNFEQDVATRILDMVPPRLLDNYKNPCWYACMDSRDPTSASPYTTRMYTKHLDILKQRLVQQRLDHHEYWMTHCMPYFYMIGVTRSGTSDLFAKVTAHPDVIPPPRRDPKWWSVVRYEEMERSPNEVRSLQHYIRLYDYEAEEVRRNYVLDDEGNILHNKIIGELSTSLLWYNYRWRQAPENSEVPDLQEPVYVNPHYMRHVHPTAKFLVVLRNPTERLYSSFLYFTNENLNHSAGEFHRIVTTAIPVIERCIEERSIRACMYDGELTKGHQDPGLRLGMYAQYLADWFSVFPREQIHLVRYDRYRDDPRGTLADVFGFLNLDPVDDQTMDAILSLPWLMSDHVYKSGSEPMLEETRRILDDFYRPYNQHLAYLMADDGYLWM